MKCSAYHPGSKVFFFALFAMLLLTLALGILVASLTVEAQSAGNIARIGVLDLGHSSPAAVELQRPFRQALRELGWVEGHNLAFESRWSEGDRDRLRALAAELVRLKVDVITAAGGEAIRAAQQATRTIPIVMLGTTDPVGSGFVASLARPGGNITGVSTLQADLTLKRLELLKEAVPGVSRVAVLSDTSSGVFVRTLVSEQARAERALGVQLHILEVPDPSAPEPAFAAITQARADALMVLPSQRLGAYATRIVDLVARSQLPAIYPAREYVEAGGLMSYARDRAEEFRRAAAYVDKILKGAKPTDLPVEQPTTFLLVINLKTAQALGLTIPATLLFQATEVIR
jgi:putative tryptophan/tyrosine transport system substrate-binding protein